MECNIAYGVGRKMYQQEMHYLGCFDFDSCKINVVRIITRGGARSQRAFFPLPPMAASGSYGVQRAPTTTPVLRAGIVSHERGSSVSMIRPSFYGDELAGKISHGDFRVTQRPCGVVVALSAEPKWRQKLAAADEHQEKTRQATAQAQEEYRRKQDALRRQSSHGGEASVSLNELEFLPYLTEKGSIADCTQPGVKASLYAIFDEDQTLCYVGVSRQVYQSMRLHFARRPLQCHYVKVMHVTRPSRALLESTRDKWISENGSVPAGNDNGELQNIWENPLDCKPLMTDEERLKFEEANPGPPQAKVLKNVARRIEKELK